jgi:hypothetical protein
VRPPQRLQGAPGERIVMPLMFLTIHSISLTRKASDNAPLHNRMFRIALHIAEAKAYKNGNKQLERGMGLIPEIFFSRLPSVYLPRCKVESPPKTSKKKR